MTITLPNPIQIADGVAADKVAISLTLSTRITPNGGIAQTASVQATPYLVNAAGEAIPAGQLPALPAGSVAALTEKIPAFGPLLASVEGALQTFATAQFAAPAETNTKKTSTKK